MTRLRYVAAAWGLAILVAPAASAQSEGNFAVGLELAGKRAVDEQATGHTNLGLTWRFGHGSPGWGWQYGLSWYATDIAQPVGAGLAPFGELQVRPFMGGYGYSKRFGARTIVTADVIGGYAFTSFELEPAFDDAYRLTRGAQGIKADVANAFTVKPEVSAWVDLNRKVGLHLSAGYLRARPEVTISSSLGVDKRRINADTFMLKIGAVYSVF